MNIDKEIKFLERGTFWTPVIGLIMCFFLLFTSLLVAVVLGYGKKTILNIEQRHLNARGGIMMKLMMNCIIFIQLNSTNL